MNLMDMIRRQAVPAPWAEGEKIPWDEPGFSQRMLQEHLSQEHDAASRRFEIIDKHTSWIHHTVLGGVPTRILDLGCGPGLYSNRLAKLGHECVGIDFSPSSIAYARSRAQDGQLHCAYIHQDLRTADYGAGYGLAMSIYGELNVFRPAEAETILRRAYQSLTADGKLLLEVHTFEVVRRIGMQSPSWYSADSGLFSDRPHIYLKENFWDAQQAVATERYLVIDGATGNVTRHAASTQAYTDEQYRLLLEKCGFSELIFYPSLGGGANNAQTDFFAIVSRKKPADVAGRLLS